MTEQKQDISPRAAALAGLIFTLIGIGLCALGLYALIQDWVWKFPLVLLMFLGVIALFAVCTVMFFYFFVCIADLRSIKPKRMDRS